jgi:cytochrome c oxidase subunit 2
MKKVTAFSFIFFVVLIFLGLIAGCASNLADQTAGAIATTTDGALKEFNVAAFRFGYSPNVLEVDKGDKVKINIDNTDTMHGIRIPDLNLRGNNSIEFTANSSGEFAWYCNVFCGDEHREMKGKLIVR